jgi:hypothetical protein
MAFEMGTKKEVPSQQSSLTTFGDEYFPTPWDTPSPDDYDDDE